MNWLLIVMVSGTFSFSNIQPTQEVCETIGAVFLEYTVDATYMCISSRNVQEIILE